MAVTPQNQKPPTSHPADSYLAWYVLRHTRQSRPVRETFTDTAKEMPMDSDEPKQDRSKGARIQIDRTGAMTCGKKRFKAQAFTIRSSVLKILGESSCGQLRREEYISMLISTHVRPIDMPFLPSDILTASYLRRKNNVDKALSRLRKDLEQNFSEDFPEGTAWICFSKKIDGWLLYRLPARGCDGQYHPS